MAIFLKIVLLLFISFSKLMESCLIISVFPLPNDDVTITLLTSNIFFISSNSLSRPINLEIRLEELICGFLVKDIYCSL